MRFVAFLLSVLFLHTIQFSYGQQPVITWHKIYGGQNGESAHAMQPTADGGYILAGFTENDGQDVAGYHGNPYVGDYWVTKLNAAGELEWQRCIGGVSVDWGQDVKQTPDGSYLVAGYSASNDCEIGGNRGAMDYWVVKLSPEGHMLWQRHYGGDYHDYAYQMDLAADGGFFIVGHTESFGGDVIGRYDKRDFWIVRADANGNIIWSQTAGGSGDEAAYSVKATPDGGCIVAGYTESNDYDASGNHGREDMFVVKLSSTGNIEWKKTLGGSMRENAWAVELSTDGGYILAGFCESNDGDVSGKHDPGNTSRDYWVVKLSSAGTLQWQKCYGGDFNESAFSIDAAPDGGYVIGGQAQSANGDLTCNGGNTDMWVIRINSTGTLLWQKNMGGIQFDEIFSTHAMADGTYVVAGISCSANVFGQTPQTNPMGSCGDFWILKLSAPVFAEPAPVVTISPASGLVCPGGTATFTATALNVGTNQSYQWTVNGNPVGTNNDVFIATGLAANDVVACRVTSGGACHPSVQQGTASVVVTINNSVVQPQITVSPNAQTVCNCAPLTFTATVANQGSMPKYRWMLNGKYTGVNAAIFISGTLKAGDELYCTYSDASLCITNGSINSAIIRITGGTAQAPAINISASSNPVCTGTLVTFSAVVSNAGANPTYQWKVNGANAGTNSASFATTTLVSGDQVTCVITKDPAFTCTTVPDATSAPLTMTVADRSNPTITISVPSSTICTGAMATFTATPDFAGPNPFYQWKVNGVNAGTNSKTFTTSTLANGDVVSCDITVDPGFACTLTDNASSNNIAVTVVDQAVPAAIVQVTGNDVCEGNVINFTVTAQNAGTSAAYQWMVNDQPVNNTSTSFSSNKLNGGDRVHCVLTPGPGTCSNAPVSSNTIVAIVHPLPIISISPADTLIKAGDQVQIRAVVTGNLDSYQWNNADKLQDPASLQPRTISLVESVTYRLQVQSDMACEASAVAVVRVGRPLVMPNAFTPNNDGFHDVFRIPPAVLLDLKEFSIFDRWGNKIFTTQDITKGWDGTLKGQRLNAGVYVYMITGNTEQGKITVKGTVTLIR